MECVEKVIKKDWLHPLTGEKLKEKDIIPLQRGGQDMLSLTRTWRERMRDLFYKPNKKTWECLILFYDRHFVF